MFQIRNEERTDYKTVEEITRKAFLQFVCSGVRGALSGPYYEGT